MDTALVSQYEAILMAMWEELRRDLNQMEAEEAEPQMVSSGSALRWGEGAEVASEVQEQESDFLHMDRLRERMEKVDGALQLLRADPEGFGTCGHCGGEIAEKRLRLVPWSRLCAACARGRAGEREGA